MALLRSGTRIYGNATIDTVLVVSGSNAATSNSTGALTVAGGVGIVGDIFTSGNITSLNANLGNFVVANYFQGTLTTSSQPNITSLGELTGLTVTGNTILNGNLVINGTTTTVSSNNTTYTDSILELHTDGLAPLTVNDGKDIGVRVHYFNTTDKQAFFGFANDTQAFEYYKDGTETDGVFGGTYGNFKGATFISEASTGTAPFQIKSTTEVANLTSQFANVANTANSATTAGTVTTNAQPNITSVGTLSTLTVTGLKTFGAPSTIRITGGSTGYVLSTDGSGNLTWNAPSAGSGNANVAGSNTQIQYNDGTNLTASANLTFNDVTKTLTVDKITANGAGLSSITGANVTGQVGNALVSGTVYSNAQPNITSVGTLTSLDVTGNVSADYFIGNGSQLTGISTSALTGNFHACVVSNVSNIVAGSALDVVADYSNSSYPAGLFTINQLGPVAITTTPIWATGGTSKNAYANFISSTVNTQNVSITFSLANATFDIKTTDTITIGGSSVTGANIVALGITGTGGTYTIPSGYLSATPQTQASDAVSVNLTTSRGIYASTGATLTNNQPVPFNVTALAGTFPAATVPYWSLNQTFTWSATTTAGATVASGNVTYANTANSVSGTLVSNGATSGTSASLDSTMAYTITSSDYTGAGQYGAGTRTMTATVNGTVAAATKYYPLFWKTTSNSTLPTFTTSDSRNSNNYATGQGAATTATASNYLWLATPNNTSHTFKHVFLGSDIVDTPDVTGTVTISGQTYSVWGFTNFSQVTTIVTTS